MTVIPYIYLSQNGARSRANGRPPLTIMNLSGRPKMAVSKVYPITIGGQTFSPRNPARVVDAETVGLALFGRSGEQVGEVLVSLVDLPTVAPFRWSLHSRGYAQTYAKGYAWGNRMHRLIMSAPRGKEVDHINRIRLDNRRSNLRIVPAGANAQNKGSHRHSTSRFRGVCLKGTKDRPWLAQACVNGKIVRLGTFYTEEDAAVAARAFRAKHMPFATD